MTDQMSLIVWPVIAIWYDLLCYLFWNDSKLSLCHSI